MDDLTDRKAAGEHVDSKNIKKHKNDVFRLTELIDPAVKITAPQGVYIRCLIAEKPPIEYPPVDYRLIIRRVEELQDTLECLLQEDPEKRERTQMSLALENVSHTADMLRRVMLL